MKICLIGLLLFSQCKSPDREVMLGGNWSVDSIYTFYNGFHFMRHDISLEPNLDFQTKNLGMFIIDDERRPFNYTLPHADTVLLMAEDSSLISMYKILELTKNTLVLREEKRALFKEKNQDRYEIRYLSRMGD